MHQWLINNFRIKYKAFMGTLQLSSLKEIELLNLHSEIMDELLLRNIIRTSNSPVADYAEWLVASKLNYNLSSNSNSGYDAIDANDCRIQIKCRRLKKVNGSRQLGVIRNIDNNPFDFLVAVIFNDKYEAIEVYKIPSRIIKNYSRFSPHQNGYILQLKGLILSDSQTEDITSEFQ